MLKLDGISGLIPPQAGDWRRIKPVVRLGKPYQETVKLARSRWSATGAFCRSLSGATEMSVAIFCNAN